VIFEKVFAQQIQPLMPRNYKTNHFQMKSSFYLLFFSYFFCFFRCNNGVARVEGSPPTIFIKSLGHSDAMEHDLAGGGPEM